MDKNRKPFKPGQLATIGNHIYRVVKGNGGWPPCNKCAFWNIAYHTICERFCIRRYYSKDRPKLQDCYFKLIK